MGLVGTQKESDRAGGTHNLEMAGVNMSDYEEKPTERGVLTFWRRQREELVRTGKGKTTERGALTSWRRQRERLVRTQKESDRAWGTDFLQAAEGETRHDKGRKRPSEGTDQLEKAVGETCQDTERK